MDENYNVINGTNEEKIEFVISSIGEAVNNRDMKAIDSYVSQIASNVRKLLKECNKDTIAYIIARFFNKLIANAPTVRIDACERFDEDISNYINNIEYEKYVLKEIKKYLKYCSRSKEYDNLSLSFGILMSVFILYNNRIEKMKISSQVWGYGIKGISYIPVSKNDRVDELKEAIDDSLNILRRKK